MQLAAISWCVMVQDLDLHSLIGRVAFKGRADADAVIGALLELEFETEDEVGVFLFGEEIAAAVGRALDETILDDVAAAFLADEFPAGEIRAVEKCGVARLGGGGQQEAGREENSKHRLPPIRQRAFRRST